MLGSHATHVSLGLDGLTTLPGSSNGSPGTSAIISFIFSIKLSYRMRSSIFVDHKEKIHRANISHLVCLWAVLIQKGHKLNQLDPWKNTQPVGCTLITPQFSPNKTRPLGLLPQQPWLESALHHPGRAAVAGRVQNFKGGVDMLVDILQVSSQILIFFWQEGSLQKIQNIDHLKHIIVNRTAHLKNQLFWSWKGSPPFDGWEVNILYVKRAHRASIWRTTLKGQGKDP